MQKEQDTEKKKKNCAGKRHRKGKIFNFYHSQWEMYDLNEKSAWAGTAVVRESRETHS